ncbi:Uncharacterized protein FWK35_00032958, partial [Aphis craccivora]
SNPANNNGEFSACIPLKYWFGLFEDFKRILVNSKLELILTRSHSDLNALKVITSGSMNSGKVVLNKIVWKVPHITVDDEESLFIPFRSFETFEYPELGTTKKSSVELEDSIKIRKTTIHLNWITKITIFDHCNITNVKFQESYYEKNIRNPILSPSTFLSNAPFVVIVTSKQNNSATASSVQLEIETSESLKEIKTKIILSVKVTE